MLGVTFRMIKVSAPVDILSINQRKSFEVQRKVVNNDELSPRYSEDQTTRVYDQVQNGSFD